MLTVKALRCMNLRNAAEGSAERQDPFVTITLKEKPGVTSQTDVCYSGGVNPQWTSGGNWMRLPVPKPGMTCLVQVCDKHSADADELIAAGSIRLDRYDEDGAEEEPMAIKLTWQNGIPAGQFHCVFSYDPPVGNVIAKQIHPDPDPVSLDTSSYDHVRAAHPKDQPTDFLPWLKLKVRHRSGKVKEFLVSRTRAGIDQSRGFVQTRAPYVRSMATNQVNRFRMRNVVEQAFIIAALILLVALPWPRSVAYSVCSSVYDAFRFMGSTFSFYASSLYQWGRETFGSALAFMGGVALSLLHWSWSFSWYIGLYAVLPTIALLGMPRFLGWTMTRIGMWALGGNLVSFGTITVVPWVTDLRRLKFRIIVVDFLLGNPRDKGFTPRFASFNRFEMVGSVSFADMFNTVTFNYRACPLKDTRDFRMLASLRVDHLEVDGLSINMEVNDRNRLNLVDFVTEYDRAAVNRALRKKDLNTDTFRFPNCLEVQVLGARNLPGKDRNGLSDPFYTVHVRKQSVTSDTVVKTLNPSFPPRVEQFFVDDPSAVVSVVLKDEEVARRSDYLGQWNMTAKWLLIDPKKCNYVEWERLSEEDRRQGWVGFWAPLVDKHFREEGMHGDVHMKIRWVYNPALPNVRPKERREAQTPLQQLNTLRHEIRQRLGDLQRIIDIIKHIPVLIDYEGQFVLNDTKISVHDVLFGRKREADNIVKKVVVRHREDTIKRQTELMRDYPRSLDVKETASALDREAIEKGNQISSGTTAPGPAILREKDGIDEMIITSADPNNPKLPQNLDLEVNTTTGEPILTQNSALSTTATAGSPSNASSMTSGATAVMSGDTAATFNTNKNVITSSGVEPKYESSTADRPRNDDKEKDVLSREEREKFELDRAREQREFDLLKKEGGTSGTTTANTAGINSTFIDSTKQEPPIASVSTDLKSAIREDLGGDKLMAVYPEKLVTSAQGRSDKGYVRGPLYEAQQEYGYQDNLYLGAEDDDEAAEMRNEDRFNDDDREYDQDGREFIKVRPIVFRKQFMSRHGDPGLNVYKFFERLIRGLIPKLASDTRLRRAFEGTAIRSVFKGELRDGGITEVPNTTTGTQPRESGVRGAAHKVAHGIKDAAHTVKDQAKLVEHKVFGQSQDAEARKFQPDARVATVDDRTSSPRNEKGDYYSAEREASTPKAVNNTRPVHGMDQDFVKSRLVIAGGLEAMWQGRHRISTMFKRWKTWHVEIKGDAIYYHKTSLSALSSGTGTAAEHTWYTLDLSFLQDIYLTDSHRATNNELVLRFAEDDHMLHLKLPSRTTTPTLQDWYAAFKSVQKTQQDRNRLGSMAQHEDYVPGEVHTTQTWPGEENNPQPRSRGSSLAHPPAVQQTRDVNLINSTPLATTESKYEEKSITPMEKDTTKVIAPAGADVKVTEVDGSNTGRGMEIKTNAPTTMTAGQSEVAQS